MHKLMLWVVAHKKTIILIIAGLLIITGPVYWFMMRPKKSLSSGEKILTEAAIKQEKYRLSDAQQQKFFDKDKELALIRKDFYEGDPRDALKKVDDLLSSNNADANFSDAVFNYKIAICAKLLDIKCMDETLAQIKTDQARTIVVQLQYGSALFNKGNKSAAKQYYLAALNLIANSGGEPFLKTLNSEQQEYNYAQIKERAQ